MTLRCDLFPTLYRGTTLYIAVRDTITEPKPEFNSYTIDAIHCRQGRLGIGYHFLILTDGTIELCRRIETVGSHSRNLDEVSVAIGIIGGADEEGNRVNTRTPQQIEALDDLVAVLQQRYPDAETHDRPQGD